MRIRIDPLDVLFSKIVRARVRGVCEYCKKNRERLECSHFHGRSKKSTRWDFQNVAALCFTCHQNFHAYPLDHVEWFKKRLGPEAFDRLTLRANTPEKTDRDLIKLGLKAEWEKMQAEEKKNVIGARS